jgi:hypothetical protein
MTSLIDVAAARVILSRAVVGPGAHNVAGCGERAPGSLKIQIETLPNDLHGRAQ